MTGFLNNQLMLPWHVDAWRLINDYFASNRMPQSLLITGSAGLGKIFLTQQFAQALLCQQRQESGLACFNCSACQLFAAQSHPDYLEIKPEETGKAIVINQIRTLVTQLNLKPQYQQYRAVVISPAGQMNNAAANAFLKCLEEPPERTIIILICEKISLLPATIVSRCQQFSIALPKAEIAKPWLQQQEINNGDLLISLALGAPLLAYQYAHEDFLAIRTNCFKQWYSVANQQNGVIAIAEQWLKLDANALLNWLVSWISDLIKLQSNHNISSLTNTDFIKPLQQLAQKLDLKHMFQFYDLLLNSRQKIQTPLNKQLILEEILIEWSSYTKIG